jgi:hypothetical protein
MNQPNDNVYLVSEIKYHEWDDSEEYVPVKVFRTPEAASKFISAFEKSELYVITEIASEGF